MFNMFVKFKIVPYSVMEICEEAALEQELALAEEVHWPIGSLILDVVLALFLFLVILLIHSLFFFQI